jgi:hypothetical protein
MKAAEKLNSENPNSTVKLKSKKNKRLLLHSPTNVWKKKNNNVVQNQGGGGERLWVCYF